LIGGSLCWSVIGTTPGITIRPITYEAMMPKPQLRIGDYTSLVV